MIDHLDHLVLTTSHEAECIRFYTEVLGMRLETFTGGTPPVERKALRFGNQKINVRPKDADKVATSFGELKGDCVATPVADTNFGLVYKQADPSERWMTSYSGPISKVAVLNRPVSYWNKNTQGDIQSFMYFYSRYENVVAYGNQLVERADYAKLGIEIHNFMVNGYFREYMVYVPESATQIWGDKAPVLYVFPGDSQTDMVFLDATQWWKVARDEGFIQIAQIIGGTVIIESIFGFPGMGRFLFDAIVQRDYPVIQGVNLVVVTVIVLANLTVDTLYATLDPRIRY